MKSHFTNFYNKPIHKQFKKKKTEYVVIPGQLCLERYAIFKKLQNL